MGYTQPPAESVTLITTSNGNTYSPTFANIQIAIDSLGNLGNESGAAVPTGNTFYVPKTVRKWVKLPGGMDFTGDAQITLNPYVHLEMNGSRIIVTGDYHAVLMKIGSKITNGTITASHNVGGPATWDKACIYIPDNPLVRIGSMTEIEDMFLIGQVNDEGSAQPYKGEGIYLYSDDAAVGDIYAIRAKNVYIERCIYGIHLKNDSNANSNSINDCFFTNFFINGCQNGIILESPNDNSVDGNMFLNCVVEGGTKWHATYGTSLIGVSITRDANFFNNLIIWDWTTVVGDGGPTTALVIDANASQTLVIGRGFKSTTFDYFTDAGVDNTIINISRGQLNVHSSDVYGVTSVADGGLVTHGMGHTPSVVIATPSVASEMVSVTSIGATQFQVSIKKHDGSGGTTQNIYWRAMRSL